MLDPEQHPPGARPPLPAGILKDQTDAFLKLSDQVDATWRMFMWANVVVVGAITTNVVEKTLTVKVLILVYYIAFLVMNYGALVDNYKGLKAVCDDLLDQVKTEPESEAHVRPQFKHWIRQLDYSDRLRRVNIIFVLAIIITITLLFVPYLSRL